MESDMNTSKQIVIVWTLGLFLLGLPANAQSGHEEDYERFDNELTNADEQLNEVWKAMFPRLKDMDADKAASLREEQRAWIAFMEKACAIYPGSGGFWGEANFFACKLELIQQRISYLEEIEQVVNP